MKPVHQLALAVILWVCLTPGVSAYTVTSLVNPPGYQASGTTMTVTVTIDLSSALRETFPQTGELQLSTDLVNPHWAPVLILDGTQTRFPEESRGSMAISGWYLSYPPGSNEQLEVKLTGAVPANPSPRQNLVKIQEADSGSNIVSSAHIAMPEAPIATLSAPVSTPTKKPTPRKIFTPIPTDTPPPESPIGTGICLLAVSMAGLVIAARRS